MRRSAHQVTQPVFGAGQTGFNPTAQQQYKHQQISQLVSSHHSQQPQEQVRMPHPGNQRQPQAPHLGQGQNVAVNRQQMGSSHLHPTHHQQHPPHQQPQSYVQYTAREMLPEQQPLSFEPHNLPQTRPHPEPAQSQLERFQAQAPLRGHSHPSTEPPTNARPTPTDKYFEPKPFMPTLPQQQQQQQTTAPSQPQGRGRPQRQDFGNQSDTEQPTHQHHEEQSVLAPHPPQQQQHEYSIGRCWACQSTPMPLNRVGLGCGHVFCAACLAAWIATSQHPSPRCPVPHCSAPLTPDDFRRVRDGLQAGLSQQHQPQQTTTFEAPPQQAHNHSQAISSNNLATAAAASDNWDAFGPGQIWDEAGLSSDNRPNCPRCGGVVDVTEESEKLCCQCGFTLCFICGEQNVECQCQGNVVWEETIE
eukprot:c17281_g1_i1.p1 GENE.c17281_g1_i1~~c17281_g1_i1.p1  ORF type:complete len:417 (+),score=51.59 c17281_g1_i1:2-1252(+)